jgi:WD repeat-containing protein 61
MQSPDGRKLALGTERGQLLIFDLAAGALAAKLTSHARAVRTLAWSPDSQVHSLSVLFRINIEW